MTGISALESPQSSSSTCDSEIVFGAMVVGFIVHGVTSKVKDTVGICNVVCCRSGNGEAVSRRELVRFLGGFALGVVLPKVAVGKAEQEPQLPDGAAQFQRLIAASRRWNEIGDVVEKRCVVGL